MPGKLIDLHTHSTASDGSDSPAELLEKAAKAGIGAIALTDHDTVDGLEEAESAAKALGLEFIRGCEISTMSDQGEMHVLGLWLPKHCAQLEDYLRRLRKGRDSRNDLIIARLRDLGIPITLEEVKNRAQGSVGRPHIAAALVERGITPNIRTAFDDWLARGGKAYVPKPVPDTREAVRLLADIGAMPVLAHPLLRPRPKGWLADFVGDLAREGLGGLEAWHSAQTPGQTLELVNLAQKHGLGLSGGSDYHGKAKPAIALGKGRGNLAIPSNVLENLKQKRKTRI